MTTDGGVFVKTSRADIDKAAGRVGVFSGHGPGAIAESAETWGRLWSTFQPRTANATATWKVRWKGTLVAAVGVNARSQVDVKVSVYELDRSTSVAKPGPVVFSRTVLDEGIGAGLQGLDVANFGDSDRQSVKLPRLDPNKVYRIQAEVHCRTFVAFSGSATLCGFERPGGLWVEDWFLEYT